MSSHSSSPSSERSYSEPSSSVTSFCPSRAPSSLEPLWSPSVNTTSSSSSLDAATGYVIVFGPQPTLLDSQSLLQLSKAAGGLGQHVLNEAWSAFRQELKTAHAASEMGIANLPIPSTLSEFCDLCNPYQPQQAVRNLLHLLIQSLTVLAIVEAGSIDIGLLLSAQDVDSSIVASVGLCSGSLAAYCFATSSCTSELVHRLVQTMRLAFWMGLRVTQAALDHSIQSNDNLCSIDDPWCLFVQGCSLAEMQLHLHRFSIQEANIQTVAQERQLPWIAIVFNHQRVSIAGPPESLTRFRAFLKHQTGGTSLVLRAVSLHAPYHSELWLSRAVRMLRSDLVSRKLSLVSSSDLVCPLFDNASGEAIDSTTLGIHLSDSIISSMLLGTARWDLILKNLPETILKERGGTLRRLVLINAGPDHRLAKDVVRALHGSSSATRSDAPTNVKTLDYNASSITNPSCQQKGTLAIRTEATPSAPHSVRFFGLSGDSFEECNRANALLQHYIIDNCQVDADPQHESQFLDAISYTSLLSRKNAGGFRIGVTACTRNGLLEALKCATPSQVNGPIGNQHWRRESTAFVFSGQGCQYPQMAAALYKSCPHFRKSMQRCDRISVAQGFPGFLSTLYPSDRQGDSSTSSDDQDQTTQLAIFSIEVSLAELLMSMSVRPALVTGHSLGFYAAAYIAGVFRLEDAIYLVARRSVLFRRFCLGSHSQMLALAASEQQALDLISHAGSHATIACYNGPTDLVLSGAKLDLTSLYKHAKDSGLKAKLLQVPFGFHSSHVSPACERMLRAAELVHFSPPKIAITSNVLGRVVQPGERDVFNASYLSEHVRSPVRFATAIDQAVTMGGITDWIEVGPSPICLPMIKAVATNRQIKLQTLPAMRKNADDGSTLLQCLGAIWTSGGHVSWEAFLTHVSEISPPPPSARLAAICGNDAVSSSEASRGSSLFDDSLHSPALSPQISDGKSTEQKPITGCSAWIEPDLSSTPRSDTVASLITRPLSLFQETVSGHKVVGHSVFSASLHGELAVQGLMALAQDKGERSFLLKELTFRAPLVLPDADSAGDTQVDLTRTRLQVAIEATPEDPEKRFTAFAIQQLCMPQTNDMRLRVKDAYVLGHIAGLEDADSQARIESDKQATAVPRLFRDLQQRQRAGYNASIICLDGRQAYDLFSKRVQYCLNFQTIQSFTVDLRELQACAVLQHPTSLHCNANVGNMLSSATTDVILHDVMLHAGGLLLSLSDLVNDDEAIIGAKVGEVLLVPRSRLGAYTSLRLYISADAKSGDEIQTHAYLMDDKAEHILGWARSVTFKKIRRQSLEAVLTRACVKGLHAQALPKDQHDLQEQRCGRGGERYLEPSGRPVSAPELAEINAAGDIRIDQDSCSQPFSHLIPLLEQEVRRIEAGSYSDTQMDKCGSTLTNQHWPDPDAFLLKMFPALRGAMLCA